MEWDLGMSLDDGLVLRYAFLVVNYVSRKPEECKMNKTGSYRIRRTV